MSPGTANDNTDSTGPRKLTTPGAQQSGVNGRNNKHKGERDHTRDNMENFSAMFSLGRGGRVNDTAQEGRNDGIDQGGRGDGNTGTMGSQRRTSSGFTDWDDTSVRLQGDDPSAPDVGARFARGGEQTGATDNVFALGGGGGRRNNDTPRDIVATEPPREITQLAQWTTPNEGGDDLGDDHPPVKTPAPYSGIAEATTKGGVGTPTTMPQELNWQRLVDGDPAKISQWKDIMGSIQDFKAYLFIKSGSCFVTVAHSPMKFAAISAATGHLQGRVIGFVGDRTATREPSPIFSQR